MNPCTNAAIEITKLTDDIIEGYCTGCDRKAVAKRERYSKKEWAQLQSDAKKHQEGWED